MRKLLAIALIAAGLWGGYWFVGSAAVERGLVAWFGALRAGGWTASYDSLNTAGFPSRFDTTITDLELSDPGTGLTWRAPLFQILALSYRPNHIIAALPPAQTVILPFDTVEIASDQMRGSVVFQAGTALTLDHSAFVMTNVSLTGGTGWSMGLGEGRFATRRAVARANSHDIGIEAMGLAPPVGLRRLLDPDGALPETLESLKIDATLGFDAPWDRFALEGARPRITALELNKAQITWGTLVLRASGQLTVDDQGVPTGRISVETSNWRGMLGMAVAGGLVSAAVAPTVERGLEILASGGPGLTAPLSFQNGFVSFGPLPLGAAPRLR